MAQIQIRVTDAEKREIAHNASLLGSTLSSYGRMVLLNPGVNVSENLLKAVATALCMHAKLVNQLPSSAIRNDLERWEEDLWLSIG